MPKPLLTDADRERMDKLSAALREIPHALTANVTVPDVSGAVAQVLRTFATDLVHVQSDARDAFVALLEKKSYAKLLGKLTTFAGRREELTSRAPTAPAPAHRADLGSRVRHSVRPQRPIGRAADTAPAVVDGEALSRAEQRVLDALAWWRAAQVDEPTRHQVAFVARYTVNGHFNNLVGALRTKGLVDYPNSGGVRLTTAGLAVAAGPSELPTRDDLIERVFGVLRDEPTRRVFKAVVDAGHDLTREELADLSGYTVNGHFNNIVGSLRSLGVVDYPHQGGVTLSDLFEAVPA